MGVDLRRFNEQVARRRKLIEAIRARSQAHVTTRDREPTFPDRHLSTVLGSHRQDIKAAHAGVLDVLDLFGDMVQAPTQDGAPGAVGATGPAGATGATGPTGPQGPPGVCTCESGDSASFSGQAVVVSGSETLYVVGIVPRFAAHAKLLELTGIPSAVSGGPEITATAWKNATTGVSDRIYQGSTGELFAGTPFRLALTSVVDLGSDVLDGSTDYVAVALQMTAGVAVTVDALVGSLKWAWD